VTLLALQSLALTNQRFDHFAAAWRGGILGQLAALATYELDQLGAELLGCTGSISVYSPSG
jgi:hypothetical protein